MHNQETNDKDKSRLVNCYCNRWDIPIEKNLQENVDKVMGVIFAGAVCNLSVGSSNAYRKPVKEKAFESVLLMSVQMAKSRQEALCEKFQIY